MFFEGDSLPSILTFPNFFPTQHNPHKETHMKRIEMLVNAQCDGNVTLCRIRGINAKTVKFSNAKALESLAKGDGVLVDVETFAENGNYLSPVNFKIIEVHHSGKMISATDYLDSLVAAAEAAEAPVEEEEPAPF